MPIASCLLYLFPIESFSSYWQYVFFRSFFIISFAFSGKPSFFVSGKTAIFIGAKEKGSFKTVLAYGDKIKIQIKKSINGGIIIVEDNGPGIPEGEFLNVFKPFYRIDKSRGLNKSGVGLGL